MLGVSGHKVAEALGISEPMVRKHKKGRLAGALLKDGSFNLERAKALYADVNPAMRRERTDEVPASAPSPAPATAGDSGLPDEAGPTKGTSHEGKARAILITEKALRERIKRRKDEGSSIEKGPAVTLVQTLARTMRDGILGFTDKHYSEIAAELGIEDAFLVYTVLDKYQRKYVEKTLSTIKLDVLG